MNTKFPDQFQTNCFPIKMECIPSNEYPCVGSVIAFHGLSACAGQFIPIGEILSNGH